MQNQLLKYSEVRESALTTTEIIKESFKNAFKKLDKNGFVIIKNNRREEESVMISLNDYASLVKKLNALEEEKLDHWASSLKPEDYEFVDAKKLDL